MRPDYAAWLIGLAALLLTSSCGPVGAPSMAVVDVTGTWFANTCPGSPNRAGCVFRLTLTQSGSMVSGTWGTTQTGGTFNGSVTGSQLTLNFTNDQTIPCPLVTFVASISTAQMSGTLTTTCSDGLFTATRQ